MKVKDVMAILDPWQDVTIKRKDDTQLDDPLFERDATNIGAQPDENCMDRTVCGMDSSFGTIVLYTTEE